MLWCSLYTCQHCVASHLSSINSRKCLKATDQPFGSLILLTSLSWTCWRFEDSPALASILFGFRSGLWLPTWAKPTHTALLYFVEQWAIICSRVPMYFLGCIQIHREREKNQCLSHMLDWNVVIKTWLIFAKYVTFDHNHSFILDWGPPRAGFANRQVCPSVPSFFCQTCSSLARVHPGSLHECHFHSLFSLLLMDAQWHLMQQCRLNGLILFYSFSAFNNLLLALSVYCHSFIGLFEPKMFEYGFITFSLAL